MMSAGYDSMGPRVDLGLEPPRDEGTHPTRPQPSPDGGPQAPPPSSPRRGGSGWLGVLSLLVALAALGVGLWALNQKPEVPPVPEVSPQVVPGATAERVAKLEKDVQDLMLRMVTLEKELKAVRGKAGAVTKLSELSAKLAALQNRLDNLALEARMANLARRAGNPSPAPAAPARNKPAASRPSRKPAAAASARPAAKPRTPRKKTYVVRKGDSLFSIAVRYKVTVAQLKKWNHFKKGQTLKAGSKLVIYLED